MRDIDLYGQILGVTSPWEVTDVDLRLDAGEVEVSVSYEASAAMSCPKCGAPAQRYDTRRRRWRHLPTCQYRTILAAEVPRVRCQEHGVTTIAVPWSDPGSGFTALFEALIIDWLREASIAAVARQLGLTWDQVDGVMGRAVRRGMLRRELKPAAHLGVDETSFAKRHEYVTVVADRGRGIVHHVADGRGREALATYYEELGSEGRATIESVAMDMWGPYIAATLSSLPDAGSKIAFDKFHVAMHLGDAVDRVRRQENRELLATGDETLKGTKHLWLFHPDRLEGDRGRRFDTLVKKALRTSRAWMLKELAMEMWEADSRQDAKVIFDAWYSWAIRSRLAPMKRVARMIKRHLTGVLNAIEQRVTNARLEGINSIIQGLKRTARGYRNRQRFRNAIYFHLGGLDLYPHALTHSTS
jgi:transposase